LNEPKNVSRDADRDAVVLVVDVSVLFVHGVMGKISLRALNTYRRECSPKKPFRRASHAVI
jgi:hypothetical protein